MNSGEKSVKSLRKAFERRWGSLVEKTEEIDRLALPDKESLWVRVKESWRRGFCCAYCGRKMFVKDPEYPYERSFSLDHKNPGVSRWEQLDRKLRCCMP